MTKKSETPIFRLDAFSQKAKDHSFYIERLETHLEKHQFISKPHNHDFYLLLYINKGGGEHIIDFKHYPISPCSFFLMTPGQVHSWNLEARTDGYILFFQPSFYSMHSLEKNLISFPFFCLLNSNPHVVINGDQRIVIDFVVHQMHMEFTSPGITDPRILRSYLELLLLKLGQNFPV